MESRVFADDHNDQTQDFGYGLAGRLELDDSLDDMQSRMQVFARVDKEDPHRQRLNIEELYGQWNHGNLSLFAGFKTINWSTAEAFHPTDVINSRNFDGPFENAEKVGELMAGFQYVSNSLNFTAFYMPLLQKPQLPTSNNRLSFSPQGFAVGAPTFVGNDGEVLKSGDLVQQWATRVQAVLGDWEFNFYWVHHFDRTDFRGVFDFNRGLFVPVLNPVDHYAFAFQYVVGSLILKSENVFRDFNEQITIADFANSIRRDDYFMSSLALEYLIGHRSGSESTVVMEFQEVYGVDDSVRYTINPFQRDLLLGLRHAYNDIKGKEFFIGIIGDLERSREILLTSNYSQRLSDVWKVKLSGRYIDAQPTGPLDLSGMRPLNNDHQFEIHVSRFF
ncbi:MAG: hypothetical protein KDD33_05240 [Bdellovibrionales bacterium]|nr:hypothetical protein [Bdellovibrionales bacterium]